MMLPEADVLPFVEQMQKHLKETLKLKEIPRAQHRPPAKPLAYYQAQYQAS